MKYIKSLIELKKISALIGNRIDYVQGGGGNTSVKLNNNKMAVKASGFRLNQIKPNNGFVILDYKNISDFYNQQNLIANYEFEEKSKELVNKNIIPFEGIDKLRPSVETGFHSLLQKYVIHTHSVYSNILCCSKEGKDIATKIFSKKNYAFIWMKYINPGFYLTIEMNGLLKDYFKTNNSLPEVIFMENHGIIVNSNSLDECLNIHDDINNSIIDFFKIKSSFPQIELNEVDINIYQSHTKYITNFFKERNISLEFFDQALYPDQLVYLNNNISINGTDKKVNINTTTGKVIYKANKKETLTLEETLLGFLYVISNIKNNKLTLKTMSEKEQNYINNWESEKYRKNLIK